MPRRRRKRGRRQPLTSAVVTRSAYRRSTSPEPEPVEVYGGNLPGTPVELEIADENCHDGVDEDAAKENKRAGREGKDETE